MGKPFKKELESLEETLKWANDQTTSTFETFFDIHNNLPLLCVGSGGSFSACHYATLLYENKYNIAKAFTPLDFFYSSNIIKKSKVLFISASGKNTDIKFALKKALEFKAQTLANISMRLNNPIEEILIKESNSYSSNYDLPVGKDGFLATNSLVAFFVLLYKAITQDVIDLNSLSCFNKKKYLKNYEIFVNEIKDKPNITVLYGGWGQPVANDIESKLIEAALGTVQLADYRNFGHGRHHWFDKHKLTSSIIAIVTPQEKQIAEKTLSLIPLEIPRLIIETEIESPLASIDLLIKSFYLVDLLGEIRSIDPGRPGVPDFGSKLYNLRYSTFYKTKVTKTENIEDLSIKRKAHIDSLEILSKDELIEWRKSYEHYINRINTTDFKGILFDYDGTLCPIQDRFEQTLTPEIKSIFIRFLEKDIKIGIVTGRGGSIKDLLRSSIPEKYWTKFFIGYYNGADCGNLADDTIPDKISKVNESLRMITDSLSQDYILENSEFENIEIRPQQLTISTKSKKRFEQIKTICNHIVLVQHINNVCILESSHSMDIVIRPKVSKLNLLTKFFKFENVLCVGDKGMVPGNDFELLSTNYSLSVDEVSYHPTSCWNFAPQNFRNYDATLFYLNRIILRDSFFNIKLGK